MTMQSNFPRSSSYLPSCCPKDPVIENAVIKVSKDAGSSHAREASSAADLQRVNQSSCRHFPSLLQKLYVEKKKLDASHLAHFRQRFAEIEEQAIESLRKDLLKPGKDTRTIAEFNKIKFGSASHGSDALNHEFNSILEKDIPRKSREKLESLKSEAIDRLFDAADETSLSEGWRVFQPDESNLRWKPVPLLIKRGFSLQQLKLDQEDTARGNFGSVSIFKNENGDELIGKVVEKPTHNWKGELIDGLGMELKAYQTIYNAVGLHPNLVNVYGIAEVPHGEQRKRTLFMDIIPGPNGEETFDALHRCWDAGKISKKEYWGAVQFIGRCLLDVTEHIGKAGVVHCDIKPENFIVNEKTGEPVLIDLGVWCKTGKKPRGGAPDFAAPEVIQLQHADERSDVFAVGATLLHGTKGFAGLPNEDFPEPEKDEVHEAGSSSVEIAYEKFMRSVLEKDENLRVDSKGAKELDFLSHSMLDDDAAKNIIKKVILLAGLKKH